MSSLNFCDHQGALRSGTSGVFGLAGYRRFVWIGWSLFARASVAPSITAARCTQDNQGRHIMPMHCAQDRSGYSSQCVNMGLRVLLRLSLLSKLESSELICPAYRRRWACPMCTYRRLRADVSRLWLSNALTLTAIGSKELL